MSEISRATAFQLPYLGEPREDEALVRKLPVANLAEYAIAAQYHRIGESTDPIPVTGVWLETRQDATGTYRIYRDPITGEIYKTKSN